MYHAPIGPLKLVANGDGISAVKFLFGRHGGDWISPAFVAPVEGGERATAEKEATNQADFHLEVCKKWLDAYFGGHLLRPDTPPRPKLALSTRSRWLELQLAS